MQLELSSDERQRIKAHLEAIRSGDWDTFRSIPEIPVNPVSEETFRQYFDASWDRIDWNRFDPERDVVKSYNRSSDIWGITVVLPIVDDTNDFRFILRLYIGKGVGNTQLMLVFGPK